MAHLSTSTTREILLAVLLLGVLLLMALGADPAAAAKPRDRTPPETTITAGPTGTVSSTTASFSFSSSEGRSSFSCRLDSGTWQRCSSPRTYSGLARSDHLFEVRATDRSGNTDLTPATRSWTVAAETVDEPVAAPSGEALTWAPPALSQPVALTIDSSVIQARGSHKFYLDNTRDYHITLGDVSTTLGGVVIAGGRNVVVMGGHITVPWAGTSPTIEARRALFFYRQVGTVHLEGTLIDNAGGDLSEGIQIDAPDAIVQIQNVRVTGVHARDQVNFSDNHPDLIQPFGGVKELRVDGFTGSSDSQGIFLRAASAPIGKVDLRRVNMVGTHTNYTRMLQHINGETGTIPTRLTDVWITPQPGEDLYYSVLAQSAGGLTHIHTMSSDGQVASWPDYKDGAGNLVISGEVRRGLPPSGEWVPASRVGLGYVSPGYL